MEVFNEPLKRVLAALRTAWSAVTMPVPENTVTPPYQVFFLIQYKVCTTDTVLTRLSLSGIYNTEMLV